MAAAHSTEARYGSMTLELHLLMKNFFPSLDHSKIIEINIFDFLIRSRALVDHACIRPWNGRYWAGRP